MSHPHRRRQAVSKSSRLDLAPRFAWYVEDATKHQGKAALTDPLQVSMASLLETSALAFTALRCFKFSDGNLAISLAGKVRGWPESSDEHQKTNGF